MYRILALVLLAGPASGWAQPADTTVTAAVELARFEDARALAIDPTGLLYVADAGQGAVLRLDAGGRLLAALGGPGTGEGRFDEPADIDPTNGLILVVADAGNGRLQRFSRDFLLLESIPVGDEGTAGRTASSSFLARDSEVTDRAAGRPVAVVTSEAQELFAVDARRKVVVQWDRNRRFVRLIGDQEPGLLLEPVALAADARSLYVADRARAAVVVYDPFGGFVRMLAEGRARDVRAVTTAGERVVIVLPERLLVYDASGRLERVIDVHLGAPLVDVAFRGETAYLLTPARLFRAGGLLPAR
ncbi:NHL repeat-containing protein [Rhodocaloribacter litoris]|uniref:NHL repeat-containing protein n=1 Tax=Rhodocaloribacter litoris TaxID=2558931 RepID=UPI001423ABEA|nr:NHL repeat-containing protein [Rhodocaloribacter litoris]QXD15629.1 NHL repeat-containing protein [Rhodocaloribacter litoris]